jgi:uncharacterized protein
MFRRDAKIKSMTFLARPQTVESPCNKICTVDPVSSLCVGCGRNLAEIAGWLGFTDAQRARIMAELPDRLARLQAGPGQRGAG